MMQMLSLKDANTNFNVMMMQMLYTMMHMQILMLLFKCFLQKMQMRTSIL